MMTTVTMKRRSCTPKGVAMNNFSAECIEQDDSKEQVMHQVRATYHDDKYIIKLKALCPMTAIEIARGVPIQYWEKE